jgi:hypothetical protein
MCLSSVNITVNEASDLESHIRGMKDAVERLAVIRGRMLQSIFVLAKEDRRATNASGSLQTILQSCRRVW